MNIQLALDLLDEQEALAIVEEIGSFVDIIEVGTSLLKRSGSAIVPKIRAILPDKPIFLDMKIIDGPQREATLVAISQVEATSMLAVATDTAVKKVLQVAREKNFNVFFDLQSVADPVARAIELKNLGAASFCIHKNQDTGERIIDGFQEFLAIREATGCKLAIAGGINLSTIQLIRNELQPDVVIIGGALLNSQQRLADAKQFFEQCHLTEPTWRSE
ncbi:orotidine 5'-phosphate decarboxylase / HUMPS family protein [Enterococcus faecalis]|uniref:orotidine 5'-phosphate decarboxylase / HUMPS family protein n=1 Tax=Enterococcus faecalis TaxID=1351 RepID=UPI002455C30C|nr:orotidine 5'-phosphate decarboxylase / HUMPS family protein [Enterococcus faecalis]MDH5045329.1 orotidine 5'-phosphate decarboxylase [Enterococcus faecalis]